MTLAGRDLAVVQLVARFNQLSSDQLHKIIFSDRASRTPGDRVLKRLAERRYLARIERRMVGGSRGGSGQYVYQLDINGHSLFRSGRYQPMRTVNYHALAVTQCYISFLTLHRGQRINLVGYITEPDCWVVIGRHELKPDLFVELERPAGSGRLKVWLEIDMGTEGQRQIKEKLARYWDAFNSADDVEWPVFPVVVFVAVDEHRSRELKWFIEQGPIEAQPMFRVYTQDELYTVFS